MFSKLVNLFKGKEEPRAVSHIEETHHEEEHSEGGCCDGHSHGGHEHAHAEPKKNGTEFKKLDGKVSRHTTIGEVIQNYPSAVEILTDEGVGCVGCSVAYWESIEEGLMGHGKSEADVERVISAINSKIGSENAKGDKIIITQGAFNKIKEMTSKKGKNGHGLRVDVVPGGCSGYQYNFQIEKESTKDDVVIEQDGIKVFVSPTSLKMIQGAKLDYLDALQGAGFKISNPNVHKTCGCGSSFS